MLSRETGAKSTDEGGSFVLPWGAKGHRKPTHELWELRGWADKDWGVPRGSWSDQRIRWGMPKGEILMKTKRKGTKASGMAGPYKWAGLGTVVPRVEAGSRPTALDLILEYYANLWSDPDAAAELVRDELPECVHYGERILAKGLCAVCRLPACACCSGLTPGKNTQEWVVVHAKHCAAEAERMGLIYCSDPETLIREPSLGMPSGAHEWWHGFVS